MLSNFQSPGEIAFYLFKLPVYFYGIILAIAIFVGFWTAYYLYKRFYDNEKARCIIDFAPYLIVLGIIGARIYYCAVNWAYYSITPLEIFNIRQGGLSVHGMIISGIIVLYICSRIYKMSFKKLADVFLCGSILAQSIGRWGNFFNSEAFGFPTNLPWKLYIPITHRPVQFIDQDFFHPTFLYESILDLLLFLVLFSVFKKCVKIPGLAACLYFMLYSIIRIFVESFRVDSVLYICGFPVAQVISFIMLILGLIFAVFLLKSSD